MPLLPRDRCLDVIDHVAQVVGSSVTLLHLASELAGACVLQRARTKKA